MSNRLNGKKKVVRVVTVSDAVEFHLRNTLAFLPDDFETYVVGSQVSKFAQNYPHVHWIDLNIERKISLWADVKSVFKLMRVLRSIKPDIVHSIMPKAGLVSAVASFLVRVPTRIHTFTGQVWATKQGVFRKFLIGLDKLVVSLNTNVFTDSNSQSEYLLKHGVCKSGKKIEVLGDGSLAGVDLERFNYSNLIQDREKLRAQYGIKKDDTVFVFLGRKGRDKGIFELLEAFEILKPQETNSWLLLVGPDETDGELDFKLSAMDQPVAQKIIRVGGVKNPELYLIGADVMCLPSYREGFGTVVIEAAALKLPAIGTKISGLVDAIVDESTGVLVDPKNASQLALAMKRFCEQDCRLSFGQAAYVRVLNSFSSGVVYKHLKVFYQKC